MNAWRKLYFNLIAPGYALFRRPDAAERETVRRLLEPPPAGHVLDLGSGTGSHARDLLRHQPDLQVTAVEPVRCFRALSRLLTREEGLTGRLTHRAASAERLPFPEATFDGALCLFVLWAVADRDRALAELARVLKPGGTLVLAEFAQLPVAPPGTTSSRRTLRLPFGHPPLSGVEELVALSAPWFAVEETVRRPYTLFARARPLKPDRS